jgi:GTPase
VVPPARWLPPCCGACIAGLPGVLQGVLCVRAADGALPPVGTAGKSTLIGCLSKSVVDNGRGSARELVFRHRHERENGRTSSISTQIMGFAKGTQVAVDAKAPRALAYQTVHARADFAVTLVDCCGHERYLKTTVSGLTGMLPDYGIVVVGANMGVSRMTKVCASAGASTSAVCLLVTLHASPCCRSTLESPWPCGFPLSLL